MKFRNLKAEEIFHLKQNGCYSDNWQTLFVTDDFFVANIRNVTFSGSNYIGSLKKEFQCAGGVFKRAGIYNAVIHNCIIEDDVYINQIRNNISNYHIAKNAIVESVDTLSVTEKSSFGNGVKVAVLNEAGGREISITDNLSAQSAYIMAFYRHRPALIEKMLHLANSHTLQVSSKTGYIGEGAEIINSRTIKNVKIGDYAIIEGVYRLINGSVNSCREDHSYIGPGVIAENFIMASGSIITESSMVDRCFVGEGSMLAKQYSAENSLFFANCQGFHGEAFSIFGGPYTVSHHKSTLLIAGYYSFLNAGSGSNQSNHMYKLGPIHQGVVERGSKTTSDSYLLWPAKIGAFSLVMGRHYRNPDTSKLPFSYLIENRDESFLAPGVNLRSIGTIRDARKWPTRDKRKKKEKLDNIIFNLLSPYSIQKMICGINILKDLKATSGPTSEYYMYNSVKITSSSLERGIELYQLGITKFLGNGLVKKLELNDFSSKDEMNAILKSDGEFGMGEWIDLSGLITPKCSVNKLIEDLEYNSFSSFDEVNHQFKYFKENYFKWAWNWIVSKLKSEALLDVESATPDDILSYVDKWLNAVVKLDRMMYEDARKEFTLKAQTGFGIDGEDDIRLQDFENVRGEFTSHPAVKDILNHIESKTMLAEKVKDKLKMIL
ncbi:DUF4954 family protein [Marinilabiliaceae bacterium ANBcel2]|nr:DUF4954 family protein [Marinilabiliaceae bacterium ANBcel2]